jgi:hypothetical protein
MKPAGGSTMIAGMRGLLASTWAPTASTTIRPTPIRIWFVITPVSGGRGLAFCSPVVHYAEASTPASGNANA